MTIITELEEILEELGINVNSQTSGHFLCYCPFHSNTDTPSFEISKENGLWLCFNESCGEKGNLAQLIEKRTGTRLDHSNWSTRLKMIHQSRKHDINVIDEFDKIFGETKDTTNWDDIFDTLRVNYDADLDVLSYLSDRGFNKGTIRQFEIGFSKKKNRIVIPVRNENFKLVGVIGRALDDRKPKYLYSDNLPKKGILFNLCHAKVYREVVVVEGSLDCMKVHQAGYPNVVAVLGSGFSEQQAELINRYFLNIVIFGDNDDAGRGLEEQIIEKCSRRNIYYAQYPEGIKDPGEMIDEQIRWAIENKRDHVDVLFERFFK